MLFLAFSIATFFNAELPCVVAESPLKIVLCSFLSFVRIALKSDS